MYSFSLLQSIHPTFIALVIFILIIVCYIIGHLLRKSILRKNPGQSAAELNALYGTLLGLLGLMLAFAFNMANSRFDQRRQMIIEEANDIGTVILRTDLFPDSIRKVLRENLQQYVEARISYYEAGIDTKKVREYYTKADSLGKKTWSVVASFARQNDRLILISQMIPALNAMIDITTTRRAAGEATIPDSIMYFLFILCCCSAFLLGYDNTKTIDWVMVIGFGIMLSATIFTIVDLDRPRSGLIDMTRPNEKIIELRSMFVR